MERKPKQSIKNFIKDIRRKTHRLFPSEQKIMIVMEAQRGEQSVAELCRKHAIKMKEGAFIKVGEVVGISLNS